MREQEWEKEKEEKNLISGKYLKNHRFANVISQRRLWY